MGKFNICAAGKEVFWVDVPAGGVGREGSEGRVDVEGRGGRGESGEDVGEEDSKRQGDEGPLQRGRGGHRVWGRE